MLTKNHSLLAKLKDAIAKECRLYIDYQAALQAERDSLVAFKRDDIESLSSKRLAINSQIEMAYQKRLEVAREIVGPAFSNDMRLSDIVEKYIHPGDRIELKTMVDRLKHYAEETRDKNQELDELTKFSLGIVNSSLSIIWSASSPTSNVYTPNGKVQEASLPHSGNYQPLARRV